MGNDVEYYLKSLLRCPITKGALREMSPDEIDKANSRIADGSLLCCDGTAASRKLAAACVSADERYAYRIDDGIISLLPVLALVLSDTDIDKVEEYALRREKIETRNFYDQSGWKSDGKGVFVDTKRFEDLRPVSRDYVHNSHLRVKKQIANGGRYLLDVACGPVQYPEYIDYSENYDYRVCVDISVAALKEAQKRIGDKGIYVIGDITNLPLNDNVVDSVISLHTIYHVPADEQARAFREIYRVLCPGGKGVVVYSWGRHSLLMCLLFFPYYFVRPIVRLVRTTPRLLRKAKANHILYFYPHGPKWFVNQDWEFEYEILVWRSVHVPFLKTIIHKWLFGKKVIDWIYSWEERHPQRAGQLGYYPLIVIHK